MPGNLPHRFDPGQPDNAITKDQSAEWQRRAKVADAVVDNAIADALTEGRAPTKADVKRAVLPNLETTYMPP